MTRIARASAFFFGLFLASGCVDDKSRDHGTHSLGTVVVPADPGPVPTPTSPARPIVPPPEAAAATLPLTPLVLSDAGPSKQDVAWTGTHAFTWRAGDAGSVHYEIAVSETKANMPVTLTVDEVEIACQGRSASKDVFDVYFDNCQNAKGGIKVMALCRPLQRGAILVSLMKRGGKTFMSYGSLQAPDKSVRELAEDPVRRDAGANK